MRKIFLFICFFVLQQQGFAQKSKADSLSNLLALEKTDTGKVKLMWKLAGYLNTYDPEKALVIGRQALFLATKAKYQEGESKSLGALANTFVIIGNYPRALDFNLQKLQLEEKRNNPRNMASALINIGAVHGYLEDYPLALQYYYRSDSVIRLYNIEDLKYYSLQNLGDIYDRLGNTDSAFSYFSKALIIASDNRNTDFMGASMTGLGHTYLKMGNYPFSLLNYQTAIAYLREANDDDLYCEATLGLAKLFEQQNKNDSAVYYAKLSLAAAQDGFMKRQLDAAQFLTDHYKKMKNIDSAFTYMNKTQQLNDSVNSKSRIRESQVMSSNEQLRQVEMEESKKTVEAERHQQLQMLFIGIFIPGFFLITLLLSRIRIHVRVIKILGILSLLILFEYLTLLLHPRVVNLTNHTPVLEMLIFVSIAALLIPAHHRVEQWLIQKLTHRKSGPIRFKKVKVTMKGPEED